LGSLLRKAPENWAARSSIRAELVALPLRLGQEMVDSSEGDTFIASAEGDGSCSLIARLNGVRFPWISSNIHPADLGRALPAEYSRGSSRITLLTAGEGLTEPPLMIEVILPVTECEARTVERELEVSEEIVESGRGMNSTVSEKPTLGREPLFGTLSRRAKDLGGLDSGCALYC
jgi:hypothetical protein